MKSTGNRCLADLKVRRAASARAASMIDRRLLPDFRDAGQVAHFRLQQIFKPRPAMMHQHIRLFPGNAGNGRQLIDRFRNFFLETLS